MSTAGPATPPGPKAASLYVRLSKQAGDSNLSRDGMVDDCHKLAASLGYMVHATHVDDGMSGAIRDRPEFVAWLEDARNGDAQALLAWSGDRLTREGVNAAAMVLDVVEGKDPRTGAVVRPGVHFASYDDGLDSVRDAEAFRWRFVIGAEVARGERQRIKSRNSNAQRRIREAHRFRGGSTPYGYRAVPHPSGKGRALEPDPAEAGHVRAAADHVLAGRSLYSAVQLLRARGSKPRRAEAWSLPSLRAVLTGDAVLGRLTHAGGLIRDDGGLPVAPWAPVLPLADVERLRALLAPRTAGERRKRATRLLSGLVLCDTCGGTMKVSSAPARDGGKRWRYTCDARSQGRDCARPVSMDAGLLEAFAEAALLELAGDEPMREQVVTVRDVPELAEVSAALADLGQQIAQPGADVARLAAQITGLQARRAELDAAPVDPVVDYVETGQTYGEWWDTHDDVAERRDLLRAAGMVPLRIRPGQQGRKGLDPSRVVLPDLLTPAGTFGAWERA